LDHEEADGGYAALELLRKAAADGRPFDVALLDFQMPGMDGATLGEMIKVDPSLTRVGHVDLGGEAWRCRSVFRGTECGRTRCRGLRFYLLVRVEPWVSRWSR
jgi:PleD family two-component response regulator